MKIIVMDFSDQSGRCESCGKEAPVQPMGPDGELVCEDCAETVGKGKVDSPEEEAAESPEFEAGEVEGESGE